MDREQLLDEVVTAYLKAVEAGRNPDPAEWLARHPDLADELKEFFAAQQSVDRAAAPLRELAPPAPNAAEAPTLAPREGTADAGAGRRFAISATTSCWRRSPAAAWASSTRRGRSASTASSR